MQGARSQSPKDSGLVQQAVKRAREGDRDALHVLYVRYAPDLHRYVNSFVHDHHEAEDIVHNVFAKLITALGMYEERDVPFSAWILRVSRNAALDQVRAKRAIPTADVRADHIGTSHTSFEPATRQDLHSALARLPKDQRNVLVLRHIVGLSPVEIAHALGKTESAIHGLHHRGRQTLKLDLTEMGMAPVVAGSSPPLAISSPASRRRQRKSTSRRTARLPVGVPAAVGF